MPQNRERRPRRSSQKRSDATAAWLVVAAAIACEVTATTFLKLSMGFKKIVPTIATLVFYVCAFALLGIAVRTLEVGIVYAVWAGTGTALVAIVGTVFFEEKLRWPGWVGIGLVVLGVLVVEIFSAST